LELRFHWVHKATRRGGDVHAAWYDETGPAAQVLKVGELADVEPAEGEVRIRVEVSGVNPGDVKKRAAWGTPMPYPRVIPHSDGTGVIDAVGSGVDRGRVGQRAWCYGAQSYRPFGTAAELVCVPTELAIALPDRGDESEDRYLADQAACLGIAGITGYRAVFADGPVSGKTVLVHGAAGGVGTIAMQMAARGGATVISGVRRGQEARAREVGACNIVVTDSRDAVEAIRALAPNGVDRIAEVEFASHIDLDAEVIAVGGVISSYYSDSPRPQIPYWQLGFKDVALRLLGSDDFSPRVKADAARELTAALIEGRLCSKIAATFPLDDISQAHERVELGADGRVLVRVA
jgi:NADPH:quinone reductase